MANVFLDPNETFPSASSNFIFGRTGGNEGVDILNIARNVTVDQNIERVNLPGESSEFLYQQAGNTLKVFQANGTTLLANIPLQGDADGTRIQFSDETTYSAKLVNGVIRLGSGEVPSNAPGEVDPGSGNTPATYMLTHTPASVDEGSSVIFTLMTTNVAIGTELPFTISGTADAEDIQANPPNKFVVGAEGKATAVFTITADELTEGPETLLLSLNNGNAQDSVVLNDRSLSHPHIPQDIDLMAGDMVTGTDASERFIYEFKMVGGRATYAGDGEVTIHHFNPANDVLAFDNLSSNQNLTEAQFLALPGVISVANPFEHNTTIGFDPGPNGETAVLTLTGIEDPSFDTITVGVL